MRHAFLDISSPSVHDYDGKMANFTFQVMEDVNDRRLDFLSLSVPEYGVKEFGSTQEFAFI